MIRHYSTLLLFITGVLLARSASAQCPNEKYAPRDRERIRNEVMLPAATLLLEMQTTAIYVAAEDTTFSLASDERAYRQLYQEAQSYFFRAADLKLAPRSKLWVATMGSNLLGLLKDTSLIPADSSLPPRIQAIETSHRVGWTLWMMLYCI